MKEEKIKRGQLRLRYEGNARGIIKSANYVRSEMLRRLLPCQQGPEDGKRKAFFENPVPWETDSILFKLDENASYLKQLANRLVAFSEQQEE